MATEYYIVKPGSKELYYLGKHLRTFEGINDIRYRCSADYIRYENSHELMMELLDNYDYDCGWMTIEQLQYLAHNIYEWCNEPVILDNDCSDTFNNYNDYTETGSVLNVWEDFKIKYNNLYTLEEQIEEVINLIPLQYHIKDNNNVLLNIATLINFIKEKR